MNLIFQNWLDRIYYVDLENGVDHSYSLFSVRGICSAARDRNYAFSGIVKEKLVGIFRADSVVRCSVNYHANGMVV